MEGIVAPLHGQAGVRPGWRLVQLNGEELNGELGEIQSRLKAESAWAGFAKGSENDMLTNSENSLTASISYYFPGMALVVS